MRILLIEETTQQITCLCPTCKTTFIEDRRVLEEILKEPVDLEGESSSALEDVEELRLFLKMLLRPHVLDALVDTLDLINEEPRHSEQYAWFIRNSQYGRECRYAILALNNFHKHRLSKLRDLVKRIQTSLEEP